MRTFLKLFLTLLALAGAFVAYLVYQPGSRARALATSRPAPMPLRNSAGGMVIGEGDNAWVRQFDDEGRLSSRFRAERWDPQKNGLVRVFRPEAELLLKSGKDKDGHDKPRPLVHIRGDDGEVVLQNVPDAGATDKPLAASNAANGPKPQPMAPAQPPSSGRLNHVIIDVYETETSPSPRVTLRTNNIVFDNETFRLSTESYTEADGSTVAPDQVKVFVDGPDVEFRGRGLTVRWNDLDQRLDLLRVAHGEYLKIIHPDALSGSGGLPTGISTPPPAGAAGTSPAASPDAPAADDAVASADPGSAIALAKADKRGRAGKAGARGEAAPTPRPQPTSKPARHRKSKDGEHPHDDEQPPYRAAFNNDVRILQGDQQLAVARLMNVDFLLGQRKNDAPSTRPAATQQAAATQPSATAPSTQAGDTQPQPADGSDTAAAVASSQPSTKPSAEPVTVFWTGELIVTPSPIPALTTGGAPATAPTTGLATRPATRPASPPSAGAQTATAEAPLPPGEARVELIGAPAVLTRDLLAVTTPRFVYRTDGHLVMDASPEVPRILITQHSATPGGRDTTITTEGVTYARAEQTATLRGDSHVVAPADSAKRPDADAEHADAEHAGGEHADAGVLDATWHDLATFRLVGEREDDLWVERADLSGAVNVKSPQGLVRSERLELAFDPPTPKSLAAAATPPVAEPRSEISNPDPKPSAPPAATTAPTTHPSDSRSPNLRRVVATDNVYCELVDEKEGTRKLDCQRLTLDTARSDAGALYPRVVEATGAVHAASADQDLAAGHVLLHLRPAKPATAATQPAAPDNAEIAAAEPQPKQDAPKVELESMTATDAVRVASKDGGVATGKRLVVTVGDDDQPRVELVGDPARVEQPRDAGTLTGPRILVEPHTGIAHVVGPGTLRAVQHDENKAGAGDADNPPVGRPVEVTWADGADVRAADNRIDITGAVSMWLTDTDESVRTANAGRVTVELAPKPPEPGAAAKDRPATPRQNVGGPGQFAQSVDMDLFKDKELSKVHLYENAAVNSRLAADDGTTLKQYHLKAQTITYDAKTLHLTVPVPGQLLVESHESAGAGAKPAQGGAAGEAGAITGGSGVTAFEWAKSMEFDRTAGRAVMDGSVIVSHQPDKKGEPLVRLDGDTVTANFDPQPGAAGAGSGAAAARPAGAARAGPGNAAAGADATAMQLRSLNARGNLLITRDGSELTAHDISYDPANEWMIARGTDRNPASFTSPGAAGTVRAGELWLNTKTWAVKAKDVNTRAGALAK